MIDNKGNLPGNRTLADKLLSDGVVANDYIGDSTNMNRIPMFLNFRFVYVRSVYLRLLRVSPQTRLYLLFSLALIRTASLSARMVQRGMVGQFIESKVFNSIV